MLKKICAALLLVLSLTSTALAEELLRQETVQNFHLSYPVVSSPQEKVAARIEKDLTKLMADFMRPYLGEAGVEGYITGHIAYEEEKYVAVELDLSYYFQGAAHPTHTARGLVYDRQRGKRMKPQDFCQLPKVGDLDTLLRQGSLPLLSKSGARLPLEVFISAQRLSEDFIIDADTVKLVYSPYELAPYAAGTTYVVLPRSKR